LINKFPKVQGFYSFRKDLERYRLFEVEETITLRFHILLEKLESQSQTILCTRGDSKESIEEHNNFFKYDLNKIFIVGGKSNYNFSEDVKSIYQHTYLENIKILQHELKELIENANKAMNRREEEFSIKTLEYFTDLQLDEFDIESLLKLKVFFLSFFHTDGRLREFSDHSPFLSMTYGDEKFSIARKFALGKDYPKEKAFIYLYSLNAGDPYYMRTNNLSKELRKIGAKWHYDKYHEILLINGMFPHYMLGIFEVEKNKTPKFIINPYLYEILKQNEQFDYINGLSINQENFEEYAIGLGYKSYFYTTKENKTYTDSLNNSNPQEVVKP
jgi:hypothetical protein